MDDAIHRIVRDFNQLTKFAPTLAPRLKSRFTKVNTTIEEPQRQLDRMQATEDEQPEGQQSPA
jgi:hypothetical protein